MRQEFGMKPTSVPKEGCWCKNRTLDREAESQKSRMAAEDIDLIRGTSCWMGTLLTGPKVMELMICWEKAGGFT